MCDGQRCGAEQIKTVSKRVCTRLFRMEVWVVYERYVKKLRPLPTVALYERGMCVADPMLVLNGLE